MSILEVGSPNMAIISLLLESYPKKTQMRGMRTKNHKPWDIGLSDEFPMNS
jgi:hypothetical protein